MSLKNLSFQDLDLVVSLAAIKTLRSTAREKGMSPAQLSKDLKRIEASVGHSLFRRSSAGITLTPEGISFRERARKVLELVPGLSNLEAGKKTASKMITIGTTNLLSNYLLPDVLASLGQDFPGTVFRLLDLPPDRIQSIGSRGQIDFAITWDRYEWTSSWETREAGEITYGLFGRTRHPLGSETSAEHVREFPFILPVYVEQSQVRFGNDRCPLPIGKRIQGHQTSTASSALRIAQTTDQLLFVPKCAIYYSEFGDHLKEIRVPEWELVRRPLYVSVSTSRVSKSLYDSFCSKLRASLEKIG